MITTLRGFGSDNNSGVHPEVMEAILEANRGHVRGYGDDPWTEKALEHFRNHFGTDSETFFVWGGTGANTTGLAALLHPFNAVICSENAHIHVDECGAPERFTGSKLVDLHTPDGKLTIDMLKNQLAGLGDVHMVQPSVISITQPTELGTLYSLEEISAIADFAHSHGLLLHMDGARVSNAAAAMGLPFRAFTRDAGVDLLSFGGAKNGMMYGEAVVFMHAGMAVNYPFIRKQGMQLASKMRFIGAQFNAFFNNDLWLRNAGQANLTAALLAEGASKIDGVRLPFNSRANAVFAIMDDAAISRLQANYFFYKFEGYARWMTSFDTTEEDITQFVQAIAQAVKA
jgi:threonine aldolase